MKRPACRTLEISIARATSPEDIAEAAEVYARSRRAAFPWRTEADFDPARLVRDAGTEEIYAARFGTRIVGMAGFYAPENFLHHLYVDPDAQGLGVGRALIAHLSARASGPLTLKLDCRNVKARGFYLANGWTALDGPGDRGGSENGLDWQRYRLARPG